MLKIQVVALVATFCLCISNRVAAQPVSVDEFAKHPEVTEVAISPNGDYVAFVSPTEDAKESHLQFVKLDGSSTNAIRLGPNQHITDIVWTDSHRVVVSKAQQEFGRELPYATGELMAVNVDGTNQQMLFGYVPDNGTVRGRRKDEGWASVVRVIDKEPGFVLVGFTSWNQGQEPDSVIYKVNSHTGERREVERVRRATDWAFDQSGKLRILVTLDKQDVPEVYYRPSADSALVPMPKSLVGYRSYSGWFDDAGNSAYVYISDEGEPAQLFRIDMQKGTREKLAGNPNQDIAYALVGGSRGVPFAVGYNAGKPSINYVDKTSEWTKLHAGLMKHFAGQLVTFVSFTRNDEAVVVRVYSDRNPGAYYIVDGKTKSLRLITESLPWIKSEKMSPVQSVEFKAKDGTTLYGFYTANGSGPKPLVVMPHGGPIEIYDKWGYDSDAQFLASRGYAVLQVNYRGSGGRGKDFEVSGWRHWGDDIQDDIADGVRWTIANGMADPNRVCIYGASFGGYSALMNPIRNPGMYKCALAYVGVYDLNLLLKTDHFASTRAGRRSREREMGADPVMLANSSPTDQVAKLDVPVLLIHGKADQTAQLNQYKAMEAALKKAGKSYETMLVDGEGHGFYSPKNIAELYRRMEAFLARNIGPAVTAPSAGPTQK